LDAFFERLLALTSQPTPSPDWAAHIAWRWVRRQGRGGLEPLTYRAVTSFSDLLGIDEQKTRFQDNIRQFVKGVPANHVLLSGARGTGKSSLVRAALTEYRGEGLRVIEIDKAGLYDLPDLLELIRDRHERFLLFCDDLSFGAEDSAWTSLKSLLDGSIAGPGDQVLVVATSNRRHLMPEYTSENLSTQHLGDEIHPGEAIEEKISLSDRFGVWLSFYPIDQETYLGIARHWVTALGGQGVLDAHFQHEALQWALARSSRSGRSAYQFARDWVGREKLTS
jgi:predicted AAA+ superfamily ATPase